MIDIDAQVPSILAAELANENLQLRQAVIRLRLELEQARKETPPTDHPAG